MDEGGTRRQYERKIYETDVIFNVDNRPYAGTLKDISMGGVFVVTQSVKQVSKGDVVTITIPYTNGEDHVQRKGRVQWKSRDGFAIRFE